MPDITPPAAADNWQRVQDIFCAAFERPPEQLDAWLEDACGGDPVLLEEVRSLLAHDAPAGDPIEAAVAAAARSATSDALAGLRLGPWRLVRELGRGGMGTVYLAERVDREFEKLAAVKVIRRGLDTADVLERFRHERQILATLDHPAIAGLLDGGTTPDGQPYLVMEYVDGNRIDRYCRQNGTGLQQRLALFCAVCDAVAYAHRNLVVHRDLKPANILVAADGKPKLLDFGIAKLLTGDGPDPGITTFTTVRMTPDYASPEQYLGRPVNTSTDIYSLGAVLYELLCGSQAHRLCDCSTEQIRVAVCETEPEKPSDVALRNGLPWARQLRGDLDNIILMALRKDADRRYSSVDQFVQDLQRYETGLPVRAREDTWFYRWRKFLSRNRVPAIAAAGALAAVLTGGTVAVREARLAEAHRHLAEVQRASAERERLRAESEAQVAGHERLRAEDALADAETNLQRAQSERARAERRTAQLVELGNRSLFQVHDAIANLPGATEVRREIVRSTLGYLNQMRAEALTDSGLMRSVATAYARLGDVQGLPGSASLGDMSGALTSYREAERLFSKLLDSSPADSSLQAQWISVEYRIGTVLSEMQRTDEALRVLNDALSRYPGAGAKDEVLVQRAHLLVRLGQVYTGMDNEHALAEMHAVVQELAPVVARKPSDDSMLNLLATARARLGTLQFMLGRPKQGLEEVRRAAEVREQLVARHPNNVSFLHDLMISYSRVGDLSGGPYLSGNAGDDAGALAAYRKALGIAERLAAFDGHDSNARFDLAVARIRAGMVCLSDEGRPEAIAHLQSAVTILEELLKGATPSRSRLNNFATALEYLGRRLREQGRAEEAEAAVRRSIGVARESIRVDSRDVAARVQLMASHEALVQILTGAGRRAAAEAAARTALDDAAAQFGSGVGPARFAVYVPRAWKWSGDMFEKFASQTNDPKDWAAARESWENARREWRAVLTKLQGSERVDADHQLARVERLLAQSPGKR